MNDITQAIIDHITHQLKTRNTTTILTITNIILLTIIAATIYVIQLLHQP